MIQPQEELRWRIEQMEEESAYLERIAAIEKDPAILELFIELVCKISTRISDLYASSTPQSKTSKSYPKR